MPRARVSVASEIPAPSGSTYGTTTPLTSGKLCSQIGSWTITGTISKRRSSASSHSSRVGRDEEVRDDEDERPGREVALVLGEVAQTAQQRVLRRTEAALELRGAVRMRAARRVPVRVAVRLVEVAEQAACGGRARADERDGVSDRVRLGQPRPAFGERRDIDGRRSQRTTTRGASSAKCSRTTNSSEPRASDSRADAYQSILSTSSPGWYGREPGDVRAETSPHAVQPPERKAEHPPARDERERRRHCATARVGFVIGLELGSRPRRDLHALLAEAIRSRLPSRSPARRRRSSA